ncbi:hypothetical protein PAPYR_1090 [Paratrimastix pyriformis]|uniref:Uncharacterized protein n=1 Tax=Paratrimastix pyriformis TaxID=342808 RepID=A0ABQ8UTI0_9EUKA|nr:hypothetical protein PAPYR_1090 [Paratrimastix pyriformis]
MAVADQVRKRSFILTSGDRGAVPGEIDPFAKRADPVRTEEEYRRLAETASQLKAALPEQDRAVEAIINNLHEAFKKVEPVFGVFDTTHYQLAQTTTAAAEDAAANKRAQFDYLTLFIREVLERVKRQCQDEQRKGRPVEEKVPVRYPAWVREAEESRLLTVRMPPEEAKDAVELCVKKHKERMAQRVAQISKRQKEFEGQAKSQEEIIDRLGDHAEKAPRPIVLGVHVHTLTSYILVPPPVLRTGGMVTVAELLNNAVEQLNYIRFRLSVTKMRLDKLDQCDNREHLARLLESMLHDTRVNSCFEIMSSEDRERLFSFRNRDQ